MKKATLFTGLISSILILIGVFFKTMHWPGAGIALVVGCTLFALIYAPMLFLNKNKVATTGYQKLVNILVLLSMVLIVLGFLFKIQHWPGAGIGLIIGNLLLLVLIPVLFIHGYKENEPVKKMNFYNEAFLLVLLTSFSFFIALMNTGRESLNTIAGIDYSINQTDSIIINNNNILLKTVQSTGSSHLESIEKASLLGDEMFNYIKDLKNQMLMLTKEFKNISVLDSAHLFYLKSKANSDIPEMVLFAGNHNDLSKGKARELKLKIEAYNKAMLELVPENMRQGLIFNLKTDSVKLFDRYVQWEEYTLGTNTLAGAITMLSKLQLDIRAAEATVITLHTSDVIKNQLYEIHKLKNPKDTLK